MIPDSIPFALLVLSILGFPIWWGRGQEQQP